MIWCFKKQSPPPLNIWNSVFDDYEDVDNNKDHNNNYKDGRLIFGFWHFFSFSETSLVESCWRAKKKQSGIQQSEASSAAVVGGKEAEYVR